MSISEKQSTRRMVFGEHLAVARTRLKLSQEALAEAVGTTARSISRWERNQAIPQQYYMERLCKALQTTSKELFGTSAKNTQNGRTFVPFWYIPYTRNPYFTGRITTIQRIYTQLHADNQFAPSRIQTVSGLGGIGKTQIALEYIYTFRNKYHSIFWINADTIEVLMSDYLALANLFQLPERCKSKDVLVREAVKRWFQTHSGWLLIFDNVEDLEMLQTMLPDMSSGHVLVTTRSQVTGTLGMNINLHKMDQTEGALFFLRRAKLLSFDAPLETAPASLQAQAEALVNILDGFPLALDQAGAYIEETGCSLSEYLAHYDMQRQVLLGYRGTISNYHPESVTATFFHVFQQVERVSPAAADLLRMCAFLHFEAIPEELILQAGNLLGPRLRSLAANRLSLDLVIKELRRFSLLHRELTTKTFNIHHLLQATIQDWMDEKEHKLWITRIVHAMLHIFSLHSDGIFSNAEISAQYQRYLPHVFACIGWLKKWDITSPEASEFLYRVNLCSTSRALLGENGCSIYGRAQSEPRLD